MTRFAALSGSSVSDYAAAGKAAGDSAAKSFDIARKYSPDYGDLSKAAMVTEASKFNAATKASAKVATTGIKAYEKAATLDNKIDQFNSRRKAGGLAAIGKIAGAGFLAATDNTKGRERPKGDFKGLYETHKSEMAGLKARQEGEQIAMGPAPTTDYASLQSPTASSPTGGSAGKAVGGSTSGSQGLSGTNLSGEQFDMSKLTPKDFDDLAFAVSSEAQLGTDDEYGVAANILTRLKSGKYGGTVSSIIHAPGQYEGVYKGMSVASPNISSRFQSAEGRNKIQEAMQRLGGRTEFKGQTMLQNRVAAEDPMFSPGGNFYHFAGQ